jgi:hypothetical protein
MEIKIKGIKKIKNNEKVKKRFPYKEISFRASGWMIVFYLGVVKYIKEKYKIKNLHLTGSSGGAVAACALLCDVNLDEIIKYLIERSPYTNVFSVCDLTKGGIDNYIIKSLCNKKINRNTLNIACTIFEGKKCRTHLFNKFDSVNDVCEYLKGSVHIPLFGGIIPYQHNNYNMYDSVVTDSHPHTTDDCLKISWNKSCECGCEKTLDVIRPYTNMPLAWCMSPPTNVIGNLYLHGYSQAKLFFENVHDDKDVAVIEIIEEELKQYNKSLNIFKLACIATVIAIASISLKRRILKN